MKQVSVFLVSLSLLVLLASCDKSSSNTPAAHLSKNTKVATLNFDALSTGNNSPQADGDVIAAADQQALTEVILTYLKSKTDVSMDSVQVVIEKRKGDYVRAMLMPLQHDADTSTVFLHNQASGWEVISLGTSFDESFYKKNSIPQELWLTKAAPK